MEVRRWRWENDGGGWMRWSGVEMAAAAAAMVMEGEEKIRVRVLGDEDDDVARSEWSIG
ncbi:hypothetical protein DEO72_LG6g1306 [Vigna unguiculata]|uniref:Uncharacterized protein n=1 Tax=Vigna unguiculata TaxID=3917 RepID=A0A4D6M7D6_VIGUN|nr:hypothetical protein DEO72_LG6g1306 [Vigna unguiculata]